MNRPELHRQLQALSRRHPGLHPYTLSLRFQAQTGRVLTGQQIRQLLDEPANRSMHVAKS